MGLGINLLKLGFRSISGYNSKDPALIHLHIPKTAGSSLNGKLLNQFAERQKITAKNGDPNLMIQNMSRKQRRDVRVIAGHCVYGIHRFLPRPSTYLCVLRKPASRLFSLYQFIYTSPSHPKHDWVVANAPNFGTFLTCINEDRKLSNEVNNGQTRRISGAMNISDLTQEKFQLAVHRLLTKNMVFGLQEDFSTYLRTLAKRNIVKNDIEPRVNVARKPADFAEVIGALSQGELDLLHNFTKWDSRLYKIGQAWLGQDEG